MLRQMHQTIFVKASLFDQNPVDRTAERRPVHLSFELPGRPSLEEAGSNSVTSFESGHSRANRNNFPGTVRERYTSFLWLAIILPA